MGNSRKREHGISPPATAAKKSENTKETIQPELQPEVKRARLTRISDLVVGEMSSDITLKVVSVQMKNSKFGSLYVVLGTDSFEFIQVEAYAKNAEKLEAIIGQQEVGKTYFFAGVKVKSVLEQFNNGSINVALGYHENTVVHPLEDSSIPMELHDFNEQNAYYACLKLRYGMVEPPLNVDTAVEFKQLASGNEIDNCIQFTLNKIMPTRYIDTKKTPPARSKLIELQVTSQNGEAARIMAWNVEADFLAKYLLNAEGRTFMCKHLWFRSDAYGFKFTFVRKSQLCLPEEKPPTGDANLPTNLHQLVLIKPNTTGKQFMDIALQVIEEPKKLDRQTYVTIVSDMHHKAQFFFPAVLQLKMSDQFKLTSATVESFESGLLNIRLNNEADYKPVFNAMPANILEKVPNKYELNYPPRFV